MWLAKPLLFLLIPSLNLLPCIRMVEPGNWHLKLETKSKGPQSDDVNQGIMFMHWRLVVPWNMAVITFIQDLATHHFFNIFFVVIWLRLHVQITHNDTKHAFVIVFTLKPVIHFGKSTNGHRLRFHLGNLEYTTNCLPSRFIFYQPFWTFVYLSQSTAQTPNWIKEENKGEERRRNAETTGEAMIRKEKQWEAMRRKEIKEKQEESTIKEKRWEERKRKDKKGEERRRKEKKG